MQPHNDTNGDGILGLLSRASPARRHTLLLDYLGGLLAEILASGGGAARSVSIDDKLFESGLSSLYIVELKHRLELDFATEIPITLFFTHADIRSLVDHLLMQMSTVTAPLESSRAALTPAASAPVANKAVSEVAEGDDVEALLLRKIAEIEQKL